MRLAVNAGEDLPNLAVFVHAIEVERREACGANNSSSFVARSLRIVTPWWQSDSKHGEVRISIYSCGSCINSYKSKLKKGFECFCIRPNDPFHFRCRQVFFNIWQDKVFNIFIMCFQWSIPWSLKLSHAVLAQRLHLQSDTLIRYFCPALPLVTFPGVRSVVKNMTRDGSAGTIVLVCFVGYQWLGDGEAPQGAVRYKSN